MDGRLRYRRQTPGEARGMGNMDRARQRRGKKANDRAAESDAPLYLHIPPFNVFRLLGTVVFLLTAWTALSAWHHAAHPHSRLWGAATSKESVLASLSATLSQLQADPPSARPVVVCSASYADYAHERAIRGAFIEGPEANTLQALFLRLSTFTSRANPLDEFFGRIIRPHGAGTGTARPAVYTADLAREEAQRADWEKQRPGERPESFTEGAPVDCVELVRPRQADAAPTIARVLGAAEAHELCGPARTADAASKGDACALTTLAPGQALYPGFHDAHGHILELGWSLSAANVHGCQSKECVTQRLAEYVQTQLQRMRESRTKNKNRPFARMSAAASALSWVEGHGWDQTRWSPAVFPTAEDLNTEELKGLRIVLRRVDVHALWVSPAVLEELEANGRLPAPGSPEDNIEGGLIVRDEHGKPTGVFVDKAMDIVYSIMPPWKDSQREQYLAAATEKLHSVGITNAGDAAVDPASIAFFQRKDVSGELGLRVYAFWDCREKGACDGASPLLPERPRQRLTARTVKLFADGALGSWGSAMWEPYSDRPDVTGLLLIPENKLRSTVAGWLERGFQVGVHCIGDRANSLVLDAFEAVLSGQNGADLRPRIEHAQIVRPSDIPRFGELGVIASCQPTHCTSDMGYVESRLGKGTPRASGAYPWRSLLQSGARLAFGSDFPVEQPDVVHGFYSAITRAWPDGSSPAGESEGWHANETLSRGQALRAFTIDAAYAQFEEGLGGTLAPGKRADFTVLDTDIMDPRIAPVHLRNARTLATVIDGRIAWQSEAAPNA